MYRSSFQGIFRKSITTSLLLVPSLYSRAFTVLYTSTNIGNLIGCVLIHFHEVTQAELLKFVPSSEIEIIICTHTRMLNRACIIIFLIWHPFRVTCDESREENGATRELKRTKRQFCEEGTVIHARSTVLYSRHPGIMQL